MQCSTVVNKNKIKNTNRTAQSHLSQLRTFWFFYFWIDTMLRIAHWLEHSTIKWNHWFRLILFCLSPPICGDVHAQFENSIECIKWVCRRKTVGLSRISCCTVHSIVFFLLFYSSLTTRIFFFLKSTSCIIPCFCTRFDSRYILNEVICVSLSTVERT